MPFLFLLVALAAGAFIGWMSILAGIWFTMPIFIVCAAIVAIAMDRSFRWRLAAFSVGIVVVFAFSFNAFISDVTKREKEGQIAMKKKEDDLRQKQMSRMNNLNR